MSFVANDNDGLSIFCIKLLLARMVVAAVIKDMIANKIDILLCDDILLQIKMSITNNVGGYPSSSQLPQYILEVI